MKRKILFISLVALMCVGCSDNKLTIEGYTDDGTITAADKAKPNESALDYFNYGEYGEDLIDEYDNTKWYRNNLSDVPLADPSVLPDDTDGDGKVDSYFIYGTTGNCDVFDCYETTDFKTYTRHQAVTEKHATWAAAGTDRTMFAPEVFKFEDTYYLYYSDVSAEGMRYIDVMTSDSPTGPFIECNPDAPAFDHVTNTGVQFSALDQSIFIDDDGQWYMYYSIYFSGVMQYIVGVKLTDPVTADWSTYKVLVIPSNIDNTNAFLYPSKQLEWENLHSGFPVAEGPAMLKSPINGKYYLTYSANGYPHANYTVCYAVSDDPLGTFVKPGDLTEIVTGQASWTNVLFGYAGKEAGKLFNQWQGFASGTAHHSFFKVGDQYMIAYHAHKDRTVATGTKRYTGVDYIVFDEKTGVPHANGPTYSLQPLPEETSKYHNVVDSAARINYSNVKNGSRLFDHKVSIHYHLKQFDNMEATLKAGKSYIEIIFDKAYMVGGIAVYNSATYGKHIESISCINFFNDNAIFDSTVSGYYINEETEFVFPGSALNVDFDDVRATRCVIEFDNDKEVNLNEIVILGYEAPAAN